MSSATRCATQHTLPGGGRGAGISTTFNRTESPLLLGCGGGFSVVRADLGQHIARRAGPGSAADGRGRAVATAGQTVVSVQITSASIPQLRDDHSCMIITLRHGM